MNTDKELNGKVLVLRDLSGQVHWGVAELLAHEVIYLGGLFACFRPCALDRSKCHVVAIYDGPKIGEVECDWLKRTGFGLFPKGASI